MELHDVDKAEVQGSSRTAIALWFLSGLFLLRVAGQILVEWQHVSFLPPSDEWFSGLLPYPQLLACQALILALMAKINIDFTCRAGWSYRPRRMAGPWLLTFGGIYLLVMVIRYAIRMSLYAPERWIGGSIPIFFHWVLAGYLLVLGAYHWNSALAITPQAAATRRRVWLRRLGKTIGAAIVVAALATWISYQLAPSLLAHQLGIRPAQFAVRIERKASLTATDGVRLVADIYHPRRAGEKTPTILVRIPYSKTFLNRLFATIVGRMWAERGYTVVIQGTRGRFDSGGTYYPLRDERQDGLDTLRWIADQPWYDGRLGMWGCSYYAYTEWVLADQTNPGPTALILQEVSTSFYDMFHPGGAFSLKSALHWSVMSHGTHDLTPKPDAMRRGYEAFDPLEADDRAAGDIDFFNDWASHGQRDRYWEQIDGDNRAQRLQAPALLMAGWYDPFLRGQLDDFEQIRGHADSAVAHETRLIIGPWVHAAAVDFPDGTRPRNFRLECLEPSVSWFDEHLRGEPHESRAPVRLYVMGANVWRDEQEWPLAKTRYTAYYLDGQGSANTSRGDGRLTTEPPTNTNVVDEFDYDPANPVPTAGGAMLGAGSGIARQNDVEDRADVLVYSTAPLTSDVEVTGPIELILSLDTSAPSTDFTGKLVDVHPDGSAYNISEGILRRSYPAISTKREVPYEIVIAMWPTCMVFKNGHRIRLEVSSSNYPRFDRNPNTGAVATSASETAIAHQSVFHGATARSRLILPINPPEE